MLGLSFCLRVCVLSPPCPLPTRRPPNRATTTTTTNNNNNNNNHKKNNNNNNNNTQQQQQQQQQHRRRRPRKTCRPTHTTTLRTSPTSPTSRTSLTSFTFPGRRLWWNWGYAGYRPLYFYETAEFLQGQTATPSVQPRSYTVTVVPYEATTVGIPPNVGPGMIFMYGTHHVQAPADAVPGAPVQLMLPFASMPVRGRRVVCVYVCLCLCVWVGECVRGCARRGLG